jgi:hypothetical protein
MVALGVVLAGSAFAGGFVAIAQPAKIGKPRPAPRTPPDVPPLPPAIYDSTLQIEGEDVNARKERSRLSVEVKVNGQGPYRFVVDSGADSQLLVRVGSQFYALDDREPRPVLANSRQQFVPIFTLGKNSAWIHGSRVATRASTRGRLSLAR